MSRQISFFADPLDTDALHEWLKAKFPDLSVLTPKRQIDSPSEELSLDKLKEQRKVLLVPDWARDQLVYRPAYQEWQRIDEVESPVLEYRPSNLDEATNRLTAGRLYWTFQGHLEADQNRSINQSFDWVRKRTAPTPKDRHFRIFEHAAANRRVLDYGFDIVELAPKLEDLTLPISASRRAGKGIRGRG